MYFRVSFSLGREKVCKVFGSLLLKNRDFFSKTNVQGIQGDGGWGWTGGKHVFVNETIL